MSMPATILDVLMGQNIWFSINRSKIYVSLTHVEI
jgi:hypothetical protein